DSDFPFENDYRFSFTIEVSEAFEDKWSETATSFLNNHFNTNGRMTTVNKDVYVLTKTSDVLKPSEAEKTEFMFMGPILNTKKIKMNRLVSYLENFTDLPVEDQTNLNDAYDISLNSQEEDPKTIHTELAKYGLKLGRSETPLSIEVLEIFKKKE
ncbi:TIGR03435 family protein, partial [Winogradskyella sp.]|nr:TIGR03435 family protein [Winogradskyella sp.]